MLPVFPLNHLYVAFQVDETEVPMEVDSTYDLNQLSYFLQTEGHADL